jgi:F420-0:gamma-glutamyl ligase
MQIEAIRTEIFHLGQNLEQFLFDHLRAVETQKMEGAILVVTSKIVSLAENHVRKQSENKVELIKEEADHYLGEVAHGCHLTIKNGLMMIAAGIDLSNSECEEYILLPSDPFLSCERICHEIKKKRGLQNFGVLMCDSRTLPLRKGVLGCGLAYAGFRGLKNLIGVRDLFGRPLKMTQVNLLDALAGSAVMMMGEADEQRPLAIIHGAPVEFTNNAVPNEIIVEASDDLYYPIYRDLIAKNKEKK